MAALGTIDGADARSAIDTAIDPFFVLEPVRDDAGAITDFRYQYVNAAGLHLYGRRSEEVLGHTLVELFPSVVPLGLLDRYADVARTGRTTRFPVPAFQLGGALASLEVTVEARAGSIAIWVRDVTPRAEAEEALRRSQARFEAMIERSGDVILVLTEEAVLQFASPALARVLGYEPAAVLGRSALDFVHPEDLPVAEASMVELLATPGVAAPVSYRVRHANGSWRWIEDIANNLLDDPLVGGIVLTLRDITAHREAAVALGAVNRVLRTVTAADAAVVRATGEADLLEDMCRVAVETGGYPMAWVARLDREHPGRVVPVTGVGGTRAFHDEVLSASDGPVERGPATEALRTGRTVSIADLASLPPGLPIREVSLAFGYRSQLALPISVGGDAVYALSIHAREPGSFDADEVALFEQLAANLAYGIASLRTAAERKHYLDQLEQSLDALVGTLAAVVEHRDPYTAGHQCRVAALAVAIAEELRLPADDVAGIEMAARVHDIGKIAIPSEILTRPGRLAPIELELIKQHAQVGHDLLRDIEFPWPVARMVLEHHERLDGSGYPRGLVGEEILPGSQVLAVADVVEAMVTHRPYRPAKGLDAALAQIVEDRGARLDVRAVDACLALFREGRFQLEQG